MSSHTDLWSAEPMNPVERREAAVSEQLEVRGLAVAQLQRQGGFRISGHRRRSDGRYPWMPHSVRSVPAQRPARSPAPSSATVVHGMHPIEGYPWS